MTEIENLNYDCNYNMFLVKMMISNLEKGDQKLALKWIRKLSGCSRTLEEMRERNEYMYNLVLNVQNGILERPFNATPPPGALKNPSEFWFVPGKSESSLATGEDSRSLCAPSSLLGGVQPVRSAHSDPDDPDPDPDPSRGAFAVPRPLPRCGAYFYMEIFPRH